MLYITQRLHSLQMAAVTILHDSEWKNNTKISTICKLDDVDTSISTVLVYYKATRSLFYGQQIPTGMPCRRGKNSLLAKVRECAVCTDRIKKGLFSWHVEGKK